MGLMADGACTYIVPLPSRGTFGGGNSQTLVRAAIGTEQASSGGSTSTAVIMLRRLDFMGYVVNQDCTRPQR